METSRFTDEISSLLVLPPSSKEALPELYLAQGFKLALFRMDWAANSFLPLLKYDEPVGMLDGLSLETVSFDQGRTERRLVFSRNGGMAHISLDFSLANEGATPVDRGDLKALVREAAKAAGEAVFSYAPLKPYDPTLSLDPTASVTPATAGTPLAARVLAAAGPVYNELWLHADPAVEASSPRRARQQRARGHEGIYIPGGHLTNERELLRYEAILEEHKLDSVLVDMKDDFGRLRYQPKDEVVKRLGQVANPADLSTFLPRFKAKGAWTIARIVVFKDRNLAATEGRKYAVWDRTSNAPWQGYRLVTKKVDDPDNEGAQKEVTERVNFEEHWVDPYSHEVWDYVARLSAELVEMGFDEIQYDYIRFPTDGVNLRNATYRWQDSGMDKESAIISFLRHMRRNVDAPISVDIYGANGWYRTGARTGQEVETLKHYVDIICPMYYPSHFEQTFLAQDPAVERPWRIYYIGTWRNYYIARGEVLIRPFVQAFFLNVSYDRKYYGADYILRQVKGVREAGNPGLSYWNNSGQYRNLVSKED